MPTPALTYFSKQFKSHVDDFISSNLPDSMPMPNGFEDFKTALTGLNTNLTKENAEKFIKDFEEKAEKADKNVEFRFKLRAIVLALKLLVAEPQHNQQFSKNALIQHFSNILPGFTVKLDEQQIVFSHPTNLFETIKLKNALKILFGDDIGFMSKQVFLKFSRLIPLAQFELLKPEKKAEEITKKTNTLHHAVKELIRTEQVVSQQANCIGHLLSNKAAQINAQENKKTLDGKTVKDLLTNTQLAQRFIASDEFPWVPEELANQEVTFDAMIDGFITFYGNFFKDEEGKDIAARITHFYWLTLKYDELSYWLETKNCLELDDTRATFAVPTTQKTLMLTEKAAMKNCLPFALQRIPRIIMLLKVSIDTLNTLVINDFSAKRFEAIEKLNYLKNLFECIVININQSIAKQAELLVKDYTLRVITATENPKFDQFKGQKAIILQGLKDTDARTAYIVEDGVPILQTTWISHNDDEKSFVDKDFVNDKATSRTITDLAPEEQKTFQELVTRLRLGTEQRVIYKSIQELCELFKAVVPGSSASTLSPNDLKGDQLATVSFVRAGVAVFMAMANQLPSPEEMSKFFQETKEAKVEIEKINSDFYEKLQEKCNALSDSILAMSVTNTTSTTTTTTTAIAPSTITTTTTTTTDTTNTALVISTNSPNNIPATNPQGNMPPLEVTPTPKPLKKPSAAPVVTPNARPNVQPKSPATPSTQPSPPPPADVPPKPPIVAQNNTQPQKPQPKVEPSSMPEIEIDSAVQRVNDLNVIKVKLASLNALEFSTNEKHKAANIAFIALKNAINDAAIQNNLTITEANAAIDALKTLVDKLDPVLKLVSRDKGKTPQDAIHKLNTAIENYAQTFLYLKLTSGEKVFWNAMDFLGTVVGITAGAVAGSLLTFTIMMLGNAIFTPAGFAVFNAFFSTLGTLFTTVTPALLLPMVGALGGAAFGGFGGYRLADGLTQFGIFKKDMFRNDNVEGLRSYKAGFVDEVKQLSQQAQKDLNAENSPKHLVLPKV